MNNNNANPLTNIFEKLDSKFEDDLITRIRQYNAIDLLSKISCASFFLKTTIFQNDSNCNDVYLYDISIKYLSSLFITKGMSLDGKKICYDELKSLIRDIGLIDLARHSAEDAEVHAISYSQNTISEVLIKFREYNINTFFRFQSEILKAMGIPELEFREDILCFYYNFYNIDTSIIGKTFKEYIDNFDSFNKSKFEYQGNYANTLTPLSSCNGAHAELYSNTNYIEAFDRTRTCFLNIEDKLYCFIPELITSKLSKYFPKAISKEFLIPWYDNRKGWTEWSVRNLFDSFFPGAKIYFNNFYGSTKSRSENDLLVDFKGFLFIVEVKGCNVSPDSVYDEEESVKKSFSEQVDKGIEQCNSFENYLNKNNEIELLFENNTKKNVTIKKSEYREIIKITVIFEEMGSYLPGYLIRKENLKNNIVLNFYDLLTIFDYLSYPPLIIRYLHERCQIYPKVCSVIDELSFLGIFTLNGVDMFRAIDNLVKRVNDDGMDISSVIIPPNEFAHEIEMYYSNHDFDKPNFKMNDIIIKTLNVNYKIISEYEFNCIYELLNIPDDESYKISESYKNILKDLVIKLKNPTINDEFIICIKPNRNECFRVCVNYFNEHPELMKIAIAYPEGKRFKITTIRRTNPNLKKYKNSHRIWERTNLSF